MIFYLEMNSKSPVRFVYDETSDFVFKEQFYANIKTIWFEGRRGVEIFENRNHWKNITRSTERMQEFMLAKIGAVDVKDL